VRCRPAELQILGQDVRGRNPEVRSEEVGAAVNQLGQVQPIGGVNAKIEGFFDACKLQGLTGKQGVIIPRQNMQHLMLRKDVIAAVEAGQFHIHAIDTIDQALEILMARPVGTLDKKGRYSKHSIYAAVMEQLDYWQAIEDGAELEEEEPKKKKKKKKKKKDKAPVKDIQADPDALAAALAAESKELEKSETSENKAEN